MSAISITARPLWLTVSNSLAALCRLAIPGSVVYIVKNDAFTITELVPVLGQFSAIIVGPGPGSPDKDSDIGVVKDLWKLSSDHVLPIFGVCLGMQSLGVEFGATVKRLNVVKHGQVAHVIHDGEELFQGVGKIEAVRYHSLHISLNGDEPLQPLAWADDGEENGRVLMALKHKDLPFWGVQYHPESVRTYGGGDELLQNFWRLALNWASSKRRQTQPLSPLTEALFGHPWPHILTISTAPIPTHLRTVSTRSLQLPGIAAPIVCEALNVRNDASDFVLLESAARPGRFSIIGCLSSITPKVTYRRGEARVSIKDHGGERWEEVGVDIWTWLAAFMRPRKALGGNPDVPFWGGFMGILSYELGIESLSPSLYPRPTPDHADVNLVFVERSIVLDTATGEAFIQSLLPNDDEWLSDMTSRLRTLSTQPDIVPNGVQQSVDKSHLTVTLPDKARYIDRIHRAQEYMASGDSYELCLTAPTRISVPVSATADPSHSSSWKLYKALRKHNPAPHSAYLRLHPSTLLSSSPERFLSFSRPPSSVCQLRPIKGTVKKGPGVTRAVAEKGLVGSVKEMAENLMIVDLIRHDLHGVVGDGVTVPQFCGIEEYETVWQLVSVIEGKLPRGAELDGDLDLGLEVLRQSLPPGMPVLIYLPWPRYGF